MEKQINLSIEYSSSWLYSVHVINWNVLPKIFPPHNIRLLCYKKLCMCVLLYTRRNVYIQHLISKTHAYIECIRCHMHVTSTYKRIVLSAVWLVRCLLKLKREEKKRDIVIRCASVYVSRLHVQSKLLARKIQAA